MEFPPQLCHIVDFGRLSDPFRVIPIHSTHPQERLLRTLTMSECRGDIENRRERQCRHPAEAHYPEFEDVCDVHAFPPIFALSPCASVAYANTSYTFVVFCRSSVR